MTGSIEQDSTAKRNSGEAQGSDPTNPYPQSNPLHRGRNPRLRIARQRYKQQTERVERYQGSSGGANLLKAGLSGLALLGGVAERRAQHHGQVGQIHRGVPAELEHWRRRRQGARGEAATPS